MTAPLVAAMSIACTGRSLVDQVDVRVEGNLVLLDTRVNQSPPLTFILDTGASGLVVDRRRARELALKETADQDARTGGGSVDASTIGGVTVRVGRAELAGASMSALDLRPLESGLGRRIDGILGYDLFDRYVVEIDYERRQVRLHEPSTYRNERHAVPIALVEQLPIVRAQIVGAGRTATAPLELDTGLTGSLTLTRPFVDEHAIIEPDQSRLRITTGALLPGKVAAEVVRVERVRVGPLEIPNLVTSVTPTADDAGVEGDTVGLLGGALLRRFTLVVDYSRSRILLEPNGAFPEADEFDMSGMSLVARSEQVYAVRTVIDGSPAAEAGIEAGDIIQAIGGRSAGELTLADIRQLFREEGRSYTIRIQRGEIVSERRVTTRRMI